MRATDIWSARKSPTISFELFPARSEKAAGNLDKAIDRLAALGPDFVSVTFGAGGSTREGSRQLIEKLKVDKGLEIIAYFAGYGLGPDDIAAVLDGYQELGVENLLVVRGDPPHGGGEFTPHPESLPHASDLLAFVRSRYDFCLGAAGYPETHMEAVSPDKDLDYLKLKIDEGAEYIVAQYFYDNQFFYDYMDKIQARGINVPVVPGVMPIYTVKMTENLASICGTTITDKVRKGLDSLPGDDKEAVIQYGIDLATEQCQDLLKYGVPGLHFYTMNRGKSIMSIMDNLKTDGAF